MRRVRAAPTSPLSSAFSNANPGTPGVEYHYDGPATFSFLARRGVEFVRIPFRWERLQPELGRALAGDELDRLLGVVGRAGAAGLKVVLDMHNYGAYYLADGTSGVRRPIGSPELPVWRFAEIWGRIASNFKDEPAVVGYGLMNEPVGLPTVKGLTPSQVWERPHRRP